MIFEVCVDSIEGAQAAHQGGAQRVELCDNLVEGGTTPSLGMITLARRHTTLALHVLIRPRGGDFCYSDLEIEVMLADIQAAKQAGADGVVAGALLTDGVIDRVRTRALVEVARPLRFTFHRAFDMTTDPNTALETLVDLGVDRILTSGQQATALEGADCIARLVRQARGRIHILAGGGITAVNLPELVLRTEVREVHFSARREVESPMQHRRAGVSMGKRYEPDEYRRKLTSAELVRQVVQAAASVS